MIEPPIIPAFELPDQVDIPVPAIELPELEVPSYEPIYVPQMVQPGSLQQLKESQEPEEPQESGESQEPQENQSDQQPAEESSNGGIDIDKILQQVQQYQQPLPGRNRIDGLPYYSELEEPSLPEVVPKEQEVIIPKTEEKVEIEGVTVIELMGLGVPIPKPEILVAAGATATTSVAATLGSTALLKKVTAVMKPVIKKIANRFLKQDLPEDHLSWARERLAQRPHRLLHKDFLDET